MINEKSAMTVRWWKRMYSLTSWALWRKTTSSCRRTVCWQELHTRSNHCGWNDLLTGLVTLSNSRWGNTILQCFCRRLLVGLVANIGRGKDGSDRRTGHPQFETFIFVCCALVLCTSSACFMHVFSLLELLTEAVHAVHVSRQCGCHEGLNVAYLTKVGTVGILTVTASPPPIDKDC